jgi:hypothetical protein
LSQGLIISPGTSFIGTDGNIVLRGDMVNNGSLSNTNNTIIFAGATQSLSGSSPVLFNNLTVASGSTTTITTTGQSLRGILVSNGTLNANGNITLLSTVTQTALIDGSGTGQVPGNVNMQRYLPSGFGYKYFSSPFQAATVNEFGDDMDLGASFPTFYRYDESRTSSGWVSYVNPAGILNPIQGYAVNFGSDPAANTADVTGVVNNGNLSRTVYNNNNTYTQGFNLAGNPYPSPIDWDASSGWTKTNIDDALYYFKASTTDQYGGTYSSYVNGVSGDPGVATNIIPSMQGFFVHVTDGSYPVTGTLSLDNNVRVTDLTHSFIKSDGIKSGQLLRLTACFSDDPPSKDPVVIYFDEKAVEGFDSNLDALKLMNTDFKVPNIYAVSANGRKLSISGIPFIPDTLRNVPLGLKINKDGFVIFRILDIEGMFSEMGISLTDNVTGIEQNLLPDNEYSIYLAAGEYQNRFFLNLSNVSTGISGKTNDDDLIRIYSSHGVIKAEINSPPGENGILKLYDLTGQVIFIRNIYAPGYYEFNPVINVGVYIVSYISGTRRSTKKIFIQDR